ncbi:MMPL family transporter, partial [Paraburkholderia sp. SIMBA_050]
RDEVADAWLRAYSVDAPATLSVDTWLAARWSAPFRHLWLGRVDGATGPVDAALAIPERVDAANAATFAALARTLPGVSWVDKAASVS